MHEVDLTRRKYSRGDVLHDSSWGRCDGMGILSEIRNLEHEKQNVKLINRYVEGGLQSQVSLRDVSPHSESSSATKCQGDKCGPQAQKEFVGQPTVPGREEDRNRK